MITFWRIFKSGFRNTFRNAWLSTAATAIMVITLLVMTFFAFSTIFVRTQLNEVRNKIDLSIFLSDEATGDQIKSLQTSITGLDNVSSVEYISKADALKRLEQSSSDGKQLAQSAQEIGNPLPASFEVKLKNLEQIADTNSKIKSIENAKIISETSFDNRDENRQGVVENIIRISNSVARIGLILSIVFLIIALLIIFNTIRMAIFTRREEIEIMKLVGATNWYIRGPFLIEGAMYGVIGATIAMAITLPLINVAKPLFTSYFNASEVVTFVTDRIFLVTLAMYTLGIVIGTLSSFLAISRHLKL